MAKTASVKTDRFDGRPSRRSCDLQNPQAQSLFDRIGEPIVGCSQAPTRLRECLPMLSCMIVRLIDR